MDGVIVISIEKWNDICTAEELHYVYTVERECCVGICIMCFCFIILKGSSISIV